LVKVVEEVRYQQQPLQQEQDWMKVLALLELVMLGPQHLQRLG
jgi:hypothetical protein